MQHTLNRVVLQGTVGPPTVRLSPDGPIFASTELRIAEIPDVTITVSGIGIDAAGIAESTRGDTLRVEGELAFDPDAQTFYVYADQVRRMVEQGGVLVAHAPSMKTFDKFERFFVDSAQLSDARS
jgi:hypothetical protein